MSILVTGGLGFIGSHTCVELLQKDYDVIIIDNCINSEENVSEKIFQLTNKKFNYYIFDLKDELKLNNIFINHKISIVIHFAGLKSVNESILNPLKYYDNNLGSTLSLLKIMEKFNVKNLIFSSSATVYGNSPSPLFETNQTGLGITSPYGKTKFMIEEILKDLIDWNIVVLRYFNPVGCHQSGMLGENPKDTPNNLFPYILKTAKGIYSELQIFGNDYDTKDGTCLRDFIHVDDLVNAHISSINKLKGKGIYFYNVGTGKATSVLELVNKFINVNNVEIKYKIIDRRKGDLPIVYANVDKIQKEIGWESIKNLEDICRDGWNYCKLTES
jgi:UDP-glucose 4-epimerase